MKFQFRNQWITSLAGKVPGTAIGTAKEPAPGSVLQVAQRAAQRAAPGVVLGLSLLFTSACSLHRDAPRSMTGLSVPKDGYAALSYQELPVNKSFRMAVDRFDPSMEFQGGKSFVEAFTLPKIPPPYRIDLQSSVYAQGDGEGANVFKPALTFLDANKNLIRTVYDLQAEYRTHVFKRPVLQAAVTLDRSMAHARYMLVHTDPGSLNQAISVDSASARLKSSGFDSMVYAPVTKARYRVDFGKEGLVSLRIRAH